MPLDRRSGCRVERLVQTLRELVGHLREAPPSLLADALERGRLTHAVRQPDVDQCAFPVDQVVLDHDRLREVAREPDGHGLDPWVIAGIRPDSHRVQRTSTGILGGNE